MSKKIMVVDDSRIVQLQMQKILADSEYEIVSCCENGEEACEQYEIVNPDLVTMDILMPGMDGLEAARQIIQKYPDANIVMISSLAYDDTMQEARNIGTKGFIYKPFDKENVFNTFNQIFPQG